MWSEFSSSWSYVLFVAEMMLRFYIDSQLKRKFKSLPNILLLFFFHGKVEQCSSWYCRYGTLGALSFHSIPGRSIFVISIFFPRKDCNITNSGYTSTFAGSLLAFVASLVFTFYKPDHK